MDVMNTMTRRERRQRWRQILKRSKRAGDAALSTMEDIGDCNDCGGKVVFAPPVMSAMVMEIELGAVVDATLGPAGSLDRPPAGAQVVVCAGCGRNDFVGGEEDGVPAGGLMTAASLEKMAQDMGFSGGAPGTHCRVACPACGSADREFIAATDPVAAGDTATVLCKGCGVVSTLSAAETFGIA